MGRPMMVGGGGHRLGSGALALLCAAVVGGCGAGPPTSPSGDPGTVAPPSASTGASRTPGGGETASPPTTGTTGGGKKDDGGPWLIRWIADLGPGGPGGGEDYGWESYNYLRGRNCAESLRMSQAIDRELRRRIYEGASAACLAALDGEGYRWPDAEAALQAVQSQAGGSDEVSCFDASALAFLQALVEMHRKEPNRAFSAQGGGNTPTSCLRFFRLRPASGPRTGGYEVTIVGENLDSLPADTEIKVNDSDGSEVGVPVKGLNSAGTRLVFDMPPFKGDTAEIYVYANRGEATLTFKASAE